MMFSEYKLLNLCCYLTTQTQHNGTSDKQWEALHETFPKAREVVDILVL